MAKVKATDFLDRLSIDVLQSAHGDESPFFELWLNLDGTTFAFASNDGRGGTTNIRSSDRTGRPSPERMKSFNDWMASEVAKGNLPRMEPENIVVYLLLDEYDERRAGVCPMVTRRKRMAEYVKGYTPELMAYEPPKRS
jgi:hypothetical protein